MPSFKDMSDNNLKETYESLFQIVWWFYGYWSAMQGRLDEISEGNYYEITKSHTDTIKKIMDVIRFELNERQAKGKFKED